MGIFPLINYILSLDKDLQLDLEHNPSDIAKIKEIKFKAKRRFDYMKFMPSKENNSIFQLFNNKTEANKSNLIPFSISKSRNSFRLNCLLVQEKPSIKKSNV